MYILIKKDETEVNINYVTANKNRAKAPKGWKWIKSDAPKVATILAIMDKKNYAEKRKIGYEKEGVTVEAMAEALWEKIVENRPEKATALQTKRLVIKQKYPKDGNG